eukprot:4422104-Prymnesium_polylepis.1
MHTDAGYGDAPMGARRARSDASISRLVLVTVERVGRRSAKGGVGGAGCQPGPARRVAKLQRLAPHRAVG